jgi:hypothetical protein
MTEKNLTPGQRAMIEDGLPPSVILTQEERAAAWKGQRLTKMLDVAGKARQQEKQDPGTAALVAELEAKAKAEAARKKADRKEAGIIRARQKAALNPKETDMAKKQNTAKKAPAKKAKKAAAPKAAPKKVAKKISTPKAPKLPKTPKPPAAPKVAGKPSSVDQVMALMCRPGGATMEQLVEATGIEPHPMRSKIKRCRELRGLTVDSEAYEGPSKENGGTYRILVDKLPKTSQAAE